MHIISRDSPCYYLTSVTKDRLPVFCTDELNQNPVRAGLVKRLEDYRWSSIRCWTGKILHEEPLLMDIDQIKWRRSGGIAS
jgi:hypothetical protein